MQVADDRVQLFPLAKVHRQCLHFIMKRFLLKTRKAEMKRALFQVRADHVSWCRYCHCFNYNESKIFRVHFYLQSVVVGEGVGVGVE